MWVLWRRMWLTEGCGGKRCAVATPNRESQKEKKKNYGEYFIRHPLRIGGPGHIVEIDESAFVQRKHNVGHPVRTQ